ncbi:hypothetical protein NDU88_006248 [Pleurodeles waltl]|uniref:Uncharacterized protein n=1 Tax=Pleurodeles waltl TaxID=8319 RepID=A0AAV7LZP8_PLEWA|nr:hypothetical protein NDU88_006248 [Pleurodeles waltl]
MTVKLAPASKGDGSPGRKGGKWLKCKEVVDCGMGCGTSKGAINESRNNKKECGSTGLMRWERHEIMGEKTHTTEPQLVNSWENCSCLQCGRSQFTFQPRGFLENVKQIKQKNSKLPRKTVHALRFLVHEPPLVNGSQSLAAVLEKKAGIPPLKSSGASPPQTGARCTRKIERMTRATLLCLGTYNRSRVLTIPYFLVLPEIKVRLNNEDITAPTD